jgi:hypothetical protein
LVGFGDGILAFALVGKNISKAFLKWKGQSYRISTTLAISKELRGIRNKPRLVT